MNSRRQALALAGALTATVLIAAVAAVAGISHHPTGPQPARPRSSGLRRPPLRPRTWADD